MSKIDPSNILKTSQATIFGASFRKRLQMMAKKKGPAEAAFLAAEESVRTQEKVAGNALSNARQNGRRVRNIFVRALGILTDRTGKVAEKVEGEIQDGYEKLEKQREQRRKEEEEKFGGPPMLIERVLDAVGQLDETPPVTRRFLLFGGPKKVIADRAREIAPELLPWPFNKIAGLFKLLRTK